MFDKDVFKKELIEGSNIILKRYDENDIVKTISKVTSCCSMPYIHVTFHINIDGLL